MSYIRPVGGYWDPAAEMCIPFAQAESKKEVPNIPVIPFPSPLATLSDPAPVAAQEDNSGMANLLFGGRSRITGCATEAPDPNCANSPNPTILSKAFYNDKGEVIPYVGDGINTKPGETITLKIKAQNCAKNTDGLSVTVKVGQAEAQAATFDEASGLYTYTFTTQPETDKVRIEVIYKDYPDVEEVKLYMESVEVKPPKFEMAHTYPALIPLEEIIYYAKPAGSYDSSFDLDSDFDYNWQVTYQDNSIPVQESTARQINYTFLKQGIYNVHLTVTQKSTGEVVSDVADEVFIDKYPEPTVTVTGPQHPKAGEQVFYDASVVGSAEQHNNTAAECVWEITPIGNSSLDTPDPLSLPCTDQFSFTFPDSILKETSYEIKVKATHNNGLYETDSTPFIVTAHPKGSDFITADFSIKYPEQGSIPFYPFELDAEIANLPGDLSDYDFTWEITQNGTPLLTQPEVGTISSYAFATQGIYKIHLTVTDKASGALVDEIEKTVIVGAFPKPVATVNANNDEAIIVGKGALFSVTLDRSWPEDLAATYAWQVSNIADPQVNPGCNFIENSAVQSCSFAQAGTYQVKVTVTGYNNTFGAEPVEAYKLEKTVIISAGKIWPGIPSATIGNNLLLHYEVGESAQNITGISDQANVTYSWQVTRPAPNAQGLLVDTFDNLQTIPNYTFDVPGKYVFKLIVTGEDGITQGFASQDVTVTNVGAIWLGNPSATIGNNLLSSYHVGDVVQNISGITDQENTTFSWKVTRPGLNAQGQLIETFDNLQTIPEYTFDVPGKYVFKLTVTGADGISTGVVNKDVDVYQVAIPLPTVNLIGPFSGTVNQPLAYKVISPEVGVTYKLMVNGVEVVSTVAAAENIVVDNGVSSISFSYTPVETGIHSLVLTAENPAGGKSASPALNVFIGEVAAVDTKPISAVVVGPSPDQYTVGSGALVTWTIYAQNFDGTTNGLSASCIFEDPANPLVVDAEANGMITVQKSFNQNLAPGLPYNGFICSITGSNGQVRSPGAILYPPAFE